MRSIDLESLIVRKLMASTPLDSAGTIWSVNGNVWGGTRMSSRAASYSSKDPS